MAKTARKRRPLSLTSLIDVIFLLLLFFMLSTSFTRNGELVLAVAGSGAAMAEDQPPIFLRLSEDALSINGAGVALEAATTHIGKLAPEGGMVLISAAPDVTSQRLADLLAALRSLTGARLLVLG